MTAAAKLSQIPIKDLRLASDNIRKSPASPEENAELKASIASSGVLVPLLVKDGAKGKYDVYAGGRRLAAVSELVKDKTFPADYPVPCIVMDDETDAIEVSIIENVMRAGMHPIDEFEAFHALHHSNKMTIADIAARFGKTQLDVKQRLALGAVHPDLRVLCRDGKLDLDSLKAYAGTDDQERQLKVYKALKKEGQWKANNEWNIHEALDESAYRSNHKLVKFVGIDAYKAAGGAVIEDLFRDNEDVLNKKYNLAEAPASLKDTIVLMAKLDVAAGPKRIQRAQA